jgi:HlyD family secretion protein
MLTSPEQDPRPAAAFTPGQTGPGAQRAGVKADLASLRIERDASAPRRSSRNLWPTVTVALVLLAATFVWTRATQVSAERASALPAPAPIAAPEARRDSRPALLTASGYVVARRKAVVSAKIQGRLASLSVEEGSHVSAGATIARLESAEFAAQLERAVAHERGAAAGLAEQQRQLRVAQQLSRENVLSREELAAAESRAVLAEAELGQARADVSLAQAQLQNTVVRAPFSGTIVKKMAEVGESVAPIPPGVNISTSAGAIVAIADFSSLEVEADVSESNVAKLRPEQPAEVTVEAFPERRYAAVLRQVIPTADRTKATVQVKVRILESDPRLKPEMSAKVTFLEPAPAPAGADSGTNNLRAAQ